MSRSSRRTTGDSAAPFECAALAYGWRLLAWTDARLRIERETRLCVSDMSLFKIAIKAARGKIQPPHGLGTVTTQVGIERIGVGDNYLDAIRKLPFHHNDPFDRYLIAQSLVGGSRS